MSKTACITGATSGVGAACARHFASEGWRLILAARRTERLQRLESELGGGSAVHIVTLDVRDSEKVRSVFSTLPALFQEIDVLVNNAGLALGREPAHEANLDDWEVMVDTNIKGLMYCTRSLLPGMVARNKGHIINVGSCAANWPYPGGNVYGATKAFVKQFSHNLRADLFGTRVRVTVIEPGLTESEFSLVRFKGDGERAAKVYEGTEPLTPDDMADIIFWVASLPSHVNVNSLEVMPIDQSWDSFVIHRAGGRREKV
jgi:3-hydroxy acid dehydrogenase/malonic semialdehyde reductase